MSAIKTAVRGYLSLSSVEQSQIRTELGFDGKYEWEHTTQETDVAFMRWIKDGNLSSDFIDAVREMTGGPTEEIVKKVESALDVLAEGGISEEFEVEEPAEIMYDVREADIPEINKEAIQKWISVKEGLPSREYPSKGDYCGSYLCVTEKVMTKDSLGGQEGEVYHNIEICYFNDLNKLWQGGDREWITVTHWTQIPAKPHHKSTLITRDEMDKRISEGELKMIYNKKETDKHYQIYRDSALDGVSYDEPLFYSSTRSKHIEDYMYAVNKKK